MQPPADKGARGEQRGQKHDEAGGRRGGIRQDVDPRLRSLGGCRCGRRSSQSLLQDETAHDRICEYGRPPIIKSQLPCAFIGTGADLLPLLER